MWGEWILNAWGRISSETTAAGFKKCCISNALDGTEDDFLWQHNEDENDKSDCGEDDNGEEKSENENFKRKPQFPENVLNSLCKYNVYTTIMPAVLQDLPVSQQKVNEFEILYVLTTTCNTTCINHIMIIE
jgi:hypothetical protein